jgi:type II secretion system protein C
VLTVFVAYQVFTKLFQAPVSAVAPATDVTDTAAPTLPTVGPRDNYQMIVANRLFGDAGNVPTIVDEPPQPPVEKIESEFKAVLKLKGTSFTKIRPNALIERQGVGAKVYQTGDEVIEGQARLDEVHNRWVYLFNIKKKRREILRMDEDVEVALADQPDTPAASTQRNPSGGPILKKDEVAQELASMTENMAELISTTTPEAVSGPDGKVIGYTAKNLSEIPLAKKIGFKDGDVVKAINGLPVDSIESISNAIGQLENDTDFRITVMRGGKQQLLKFKLE